MQKKRIDGICEEAIFKEENGWEFSREKQDMSAYIESALLVSSKINKNKSIPKYIVVGTTEAQRGRENPKMLSENIGQTWRNSS